MNRIEVLAPDDVPEVRRGDDLAALLTASVELADGDIVVVTSKVVSKAEGRVVDGSRDDALPRETARVVARRGATTIVRTHHGLTLAAAGIDASHVEAGRVVLLPVDPDDSARRLRDALPVNVGVVITDTAGRAWRDGQTDIAIGAAGLIVAEDFAGQEDAHGNLLVVTRPAVADEIAGAAELAQGKLGGRPFAVLRGRPDLVLPAGHDGPGAVALVRPEGADLFGFGAREAVIRALAAAPEDLAVFGDPVPVEDLPELLAQALGASWVAIVPSEGTEVVVELETPRAAATQALATACFACGWEVLDSSTGRAGMVRATLRPATP